MRRCEMLKEAQVVLSTRMLQQKGLKRGVRPCTQRVMRAIQMLGDKIAAANRAKR